MTMKLLFTLLLSLLLAGCSAPAEAVPIQAAPVPEVPDSLRAQYDSTVEAASLPLQDVRQLWDTEAGLLLLSENTLMLLDESLQPAALRTLDFTPGITVSGSVISAFDAGTRRLLLLDAALEEIRFLTLPADLSGSPVFAGSTVWYCTPGGIYRWELDSGIRRRIREDAGTGQTLAAVHADGTILQYRIREEARQRDLFLDARTGQLLQELDTTARLDHLDGRYYCQFTAGSLENRIFGTRDSEAMGLFPEAAFADCHFLPESHAAVTLEEGLLTYYDLETGRIRDTLPLHHTPKAILEHNGSVLLLITVDGQEILLRWQPGELPSSGKDHTDPWFTADDPDHTGLSLCRDYAQRLSEEYGMEVLIWKEAAAAAPWDYAFTEEHRYPVILSQLQTLEDCLTRYPKEVLEETAACFDSLTVCLVQSITGTAGSSSLTTATGIQFLNGSDAYVVLAAGEHMEQALYHELFHVMETLLLSRSSALDRWNELNPAGFSYDLDHAVNAQRNSGVYLEKQTRAFVDTYSMSYPKEDRARIFEYAMLPDMEHLFTPKTMQSKLKAVCDGIRTAYGLTEYTSPLPWEQYLQ